MFSKNHGPTLSDLSTDLADESDWKIGSLRTFDFLLDVTALAVEPIAGILAVGTGSGAIYLFGGPSVESKITLPEPIGVKFLQISSSTYFILCLDDLNHLYLYNLLEFGRPKLVTSARLDPTNSIALSPSHTHAFFALQNGEIRTYDMTCLRKSPYTMPNMWKLYEEGLEASGIPPVELPTPQNAVEVVIHPRDLNLLFVAYAGGVILTNLTDRSTVRAYDLILPPGSPGGAGYEMEDILTPRRMMVTGLAVHPSGHFFVVGYADGSFAFWAVEDDEKPLSVRTIDQANVNVVDSEKLEAHLDNHGRPRRSVLNREPVFKLSWSGFSNSTDPRGGETVLTILGGLETGKPPGVNILALPPFNPLDPPASPPTQPNTLHPDFRQAMVKAVAPTKSYFYRTHGVVQDYLVIPKGSPHFGGTFDPGSIVFVVDIEGTRTATALQMPPPGFVATAIKEPFESPPSSTIHDESTSPTSLKSPQAPPPLPKSPRHLTQVEPPRELRTPFPISNAHAGILGGHLFSLDNDGYENFVLQKAEDEYVLQLKGGKTFADPTQLNDLKLSKYQPRRIWMTFNQDLSVRFFDLSTTLLIPAANSPLSHAWPEPIPGMSINIDALCDDPIMSEALADSMRSLSIASVQVALDALEVAVAFDSGELVVFHEQPAQAEGATPPRSSAEPEFILLDHITSHSAASRLGPYFLLKGEKGPIEAYALSDVGFLSVSYRDGSLSIVDMRGPRVIYSISSDSKKQKHRSNVPVPGSPTQSGPDIVKSLKWCISPLEKDPQLRVHLLAVRQSGQGEIYTLVGSGHPATWSVRGEPISIKGFSEPLSDGLFVLDTKKGTELKANPSRFAAALRNEKVGTSGLPSCMLVAVGAKGARIAANVSGEKLAKVEWSHKAGNAIAAQVISHSGAQALVVQSERSGLLVYSLPYLEHLTTITPLHPSPLPIYIDDSGDFILWKAPGLNSRGGQSPHVLVGGATYGTLFDVRRAYSLPDIDFASTRGTVPSQPLPISMGPATLYQAGIHLGSWLGFGGNKTGAQIDDLLGGPDRPLPEKVAAEKARQAAEDAGEDVNTSQISAAGAAAGAAASSVYNRLAGALGERGQMLGDLEERFQSLEQGSKDMVSQAKRLAAQQTAKGWFGF